MSERILGITAEYDPFHNGHRYHLNCAREAARPEGVVCVMSGDFTQRGEPAIADKWRRARIALHQGVDLVLELPFLCACNRADRFAAGAVDILAGAGVSHIAFGCETEHPERLAELARLQLSCGSRWEARIREEMKGGLSRAKAAQIAGDALFGEDLNRLSLEPNNILALEYLKRIRFWEERGRRIEAVPILRYGAGHKEADVRCDPADGHPFAVSMVAGTAGSEPRVAGDSAPGVDSCFAGGSVLRRMLCCGEDIRPFVPGETAETLNWLDQESARREMLRQLQGIVLRSTPEELENIYCVGEGLENRLHREIREAESYDGLLDRMTSKRYTASAIRRILTYILMGLPGGRADAILSGRSDGPTGTRYGRLLAANEAGRRILGSAPSMPVIANINRTQNLPSLIRDSLSLDIRAADLYHLLRGESITENDDRRKQPWVE
ncbi:MAG: nucleotidyltransferase family protein [Bacillota bacterium]|nr:nucleotidyltransferase family protein [Bacillota bacterium]